MKKEIIILLAVIVALSSYLFLRDTDGTGYELPVLETVSTGDVDRLEIQAEAETLLFEKQGDGWTVDLEGFPAKKEAVTNLVKTAGDLTLTAMVSESASYNRYDLGPDKARTVRLFNGETLLREIAVGKAAPSLGHTFVTVEGDKKVYHAKGNFASQFTTDPARFIDTKVFSFTADEVTALSVTQGEKTMHVSPTSQPGTDEGKPETIWQDGTGASVDKTKVTNLLGTLTNLSCEKWLVKKEEGTPRATLTVTTDRPHTLALFGDAPKTGTASDTPFAFVLSDATDARIMDALTALIQNNPTANAQEAN